MSRPAPKPPEADPALEFDDAADRAAYRSALANAVAVWAFWQGRGFTIDARVVRDPYVRGVVGRRGWSVRTDLKNGLPLGITRKQAMELARVR